jgi:predicted amidohydrolase
MPLDRKPYPSDPADLFLRLYADLSPAAVTDDLVEEWFDSIQDFADYVAETSLNGGAFDPEQVHDAIDEYPDDPDERRYGYLLGLDRAFAYLHPDLDAAALAGDLTDLLRRFRTDGRFNVDPQLGALLPRYTAPPRLGLTNPPDWEQKADLFSNVTCVSPENWAQLRSARVPRINDVPAAARLEGVTVACVPMCGRDDAVIEPAPNTQRASYLVTPRNTKALRDRIPEVIRVLDASRADVAVLPELTLRKELLAHWRRALAAPPPPGSRLRLIMAGTGPLVEAAVSGQVVNRGVILARSGELLATQDKRHPFLLTADQIAEWGLADALGPDARAEPLHPGASLTVLESGMGRICILICEDLGRTTSDGLLLAEVGPSHILAPVLSKPTTSHRWEHSDAKKWASAIGSHTIVSNSLIIAEAMERAGLEPENGPGTALAHAADGTYEYDYTDDPANARVFRFAPEGVVLVARVDRNT